jgi:hypothetical protein
MATATLQESEKVESSESEESDAEQNPHLRLPPVVCRTR